MDPSLLPISVYKFPPVDIQRIQDALNLNLRPFYEKVNVEIVECPDLTSSPFDLAVTGFGGGENGIIDLGGVPYLVPKADTTRIYDLCQVTAKCLSTSSDLDFGKDIYLSGAGAGPFPSQGSNCEMIINMIIGPEGNVIQNKSKVALINKTVGLNEVELRDLPNTESRCALLANFLVSSAVPGKVLKIECEGRIDGSVNFTSSLRQAMLKHFGPNEPVGLGGLFTVTRSQSKIHIMPNFSEVPLLTDEDVDKWLRYFDMDPPMLFQSILVSHDPGYDLRIEHSHGWSLEKDEGGHYHYDLSPQQVKYVGYYAVATRLWRVDQPKVTHVIGRD